MKKILIITILFIPLAHPSEKQLTCPYFSYDKIGFLEDSAWRIDKFIFSTEDFTKDEPYLTHHIKVKYTSNEISIDLAIDEVCKSRGCTEEEKKLLLNELSSGVDIEKSLMSKFTVSPTHINISDGFGGGFFSINRSNLNLTWDTGTSGTRESKCKIEDIETPENNIF